MSFFFSLPLSHSEEGWSEARLKQRKKKSFTYLADKLERLAVVVDGVPELGPGSREAGQGVGRDGGNGRHALIVGPAERGGRRQRGPERGGYLGRGRDDLPRGAPVIEVLERRDVGSQLGPLDLGRVEEPVDEGDVGQGRAGDGEVALLLGVFFFFRKRKKLVFDFFFSKW